VALLRLLAVVLALATARMVATDLATLHARSASLGPIVDVIETDRPLGLGTTIERDDVRVVQRHETQSPRDVIGDLDSVIGRVVVVPLVAGAPIFESNLADASRSGTAELLGTGNVGIRIANVGGPNVAPGSYVRVFATIDPGSGFSGSGSTLVVVDRARVIEVVRDDTEPGLMLEVKGEQASDLAFAIAHGVVTVALLAPEDACCDEPQSGSSTSEPSSSVSPSSAPPRSPG
jgi:Flp pilus assembly protein CpaB